jgi:diazepam-binding inhibitor (GABA receptor modulator, acyl-CoA-binding protein)
MSTSILIRAGMSVIDEFERVQADVKKLALRPGPNNDVLLKLYALYKQGTYGVAGGNRHGVRDPIGRAKYDAWKALAGTAQGDAQQDYIDAGPDLPGEIKEKIMGLVPRRVPSATPMPAAVAASSSST